MHILGKFQVILLNSLKDIVDFPTSQNPASQSGVMEHLVCISNKSEHLKND